MFYIFLFMVNKSYGLLVSISLSELLMILGLLLISEISLVIDFSLLEDVELEEYFVVKF